MDRLSTLTTLTLGMALVACGTKADTPAAPLPSRTDGAKVATGQAATTDAFCDLHAKDGKATAFHWPELATAGAPSAATGWRWVNVWATWCEPCIEEMPRLVAWRDKLAAAGKPVELAFVSVDDSDADVDAFRKAHPGVPPSVRIVSAEKRTSWLASLGLGDGAIPIQLFVSPTNKLRCVRAGGIREKDYGVIEQLLVE
jgi:thiol-disulfide isomerase/thioredoxin